MKFKEVALPASMRANIMRVTGSSPQAGSYRRFVADLPSGEVVSVLQSRTPCGQLPDGRPDLRWHLSVSIMGQERLPNWDEMKLVRRALKPEVFFIIGMPPEKHWLNYGEVLHLSEVKDENLIQQWIYEGARYRDDAARGLGYGSTLGDVARGTRENR